MRNILFLILIFLQFTPGMSYGQEKEMLIEQIAGKKIVRKNFDKNGNPQGMQIFLTGELKRERETYTVEVLVELYDEKNQLDEKYTTTYKCNPREFDVLLNVFPFTDPGDEKIKVDVTSEDFKQLYDLQSSSKLKDIHLKMSVESGVLSFFGSKSLVTIKNRQSKKENGRINISSDAVVEAYVMGLKIKTINYTVEEYLTESLVLQRQKFTEDDGAYFTMTYEQKTKE
tara:strand:- start:3687 stop:4370 length:684 start_codon:yes stop_codon:yes gene_type:complete